VHLKDTLEAPVGAVSTTHGQKCNVDLGLPKGHVDISIHEHRACLMAHLSQSAGDGLACSNRGVSLDRQTTKQDTNLTAGTHAPPVPFIWASVKKTHNLSLTLLLAPQSYGLW
jgi:hypothetical protein